MRLELVMCFALALTLGASELTMADSLPLFDGHIHYNLDAPERYPPEAVVRILDEAGITGALLSSK